jgi:hypothetical protein
MRTLIVMAMLLLSNIQTAPIKAEEFTQFFKDFSTYCVEGVGSPLHYKEMAKLEHWKALPEKLKPLLKNQNGDDFDGWAYEREKGNVYAIAFLSGIDQGKKFHTCSLVNLASDYGRNVQLAKKYFNAKKIDEYNMGMQYMEVFSIRLSRFSDSTLFTNQDRSASNGSDMFKFDLAVYE